MAAVKTETTEFNPTIRNHDAQAKTIMEIVSQFIDRFILLPTPDLYVLVSAWILATHLHQHFDYLGYLLAYSPEKESGKTTLLKVLDLVVFQSTGLQVSPTPAVLFRTAENHTQLLDEVDSWTNDADLKDILNAGYEQGGAVTRCDRNTNGFKVNKFPVFAPRALAGIGYNKLHQTTLDRTFAIAMIRQMKTEKREHLRPRKIGEGAARIKKLIEQWAAESKENVVRAYEESAFDYLNCFSDRTMDIAEPLAAIVEVVYGKHSGLAQARESLVSAIAATRREQHTPSENHKLLLHLLKLAETEDPLVGSPTELAAQCANLDPSPTHHTVSHVLRNYGFASTSQRTGTGMPRYCYTLRKDRLQELVERWIPQVATEATVAAACHDPV